MKMHCYFLLNVKHGASQLYLGGLQLSSAGTARKWKDVQAIDQERSHRSLGGGGNWPSNVFLAPTPLKNTLPSKL